MTNIERYRRNRSRFGLAELGRYHGQWVAFSLDGTRIVAAHEDPARLEELIVSAGESPERVAFEKIDLTDDIYLGGAELETISTSPTPLSLSQD